MSNCNVYCGPTGSSSIVACYRIGADTFVPVEIVRLSDNSKPPRVYRLGTRERIVPVDPDRLFIPGGCNPDANGEPNIVSSLVLDAENNLTLSQSGGDDVVVDLSSLAADIHSDGLAFDEATRELTITLTGGADPLVVTIPPAASDFPDGVEQQIITYDGAGVPIAVSLEEYNQSIIQTVTGADGWSTNPDLMLIALDSQTGNLAAARTKWAWGDSPDDYGSIVTRSDDQSGTPGRIAGADPTDEFDMVNLRYLENELVWDRGTVYTVKPTATGTRDLAAGEGAIASGGDSIAVGELAESQGVSSIVIGRRAKVLGTVAQKANCIVIGTQAECSGVDMNVGGAIAIGRTSQVTQNNGIALGSGAQADHAGSSAIGQNSTTTKADQVAFASPTATRFLSRVKDGVEPQDAATVNQLDGRLSAAQRTAIDALAAIADPTTATAQDCANKINEVIAALKAV